MNVSISGPPLPCSYRQEKPPTGGWSSKVASRLPQLLRKSKGTPGDQRYRHARSPLQTLSVSSMGIGNGICMTLANMQSHDLTGLRIHSKKRRIVDDVSRLGIGIDLPVVGQNVFNDKRHRRGRHILEKVFLLYNRNLVA